MRAMLVLLMSSLILLIAACGGKSCVPQTVVIQAPPKYCPRPLPPTLIKATSEGKVLTPVLIRDAKLVEKWALELEATVDCYEGVGDASEK